MYKLCEKLGRNNVICYVKRKPSSVNVKCGAAKIYGLCLGFEFYLYTDQFSSSLVGVHQTLKNTILMI